MKWSFVLSSFVVSMLSVNAFALDAQTAQIISHKEWTTGNIKGSYKDAVLDPKNIKSVMLHQLSIKNKKQLSGNVDGNDNFVSVDLDGSYQRLQTPDDEYGVHGYPDIDMLNGTNVEHLYKINSKLCIYDYYGGEIIELGCYHIENVAKLSPHQYTDFRSGMQAVFQYDKSHAYLGVLSVDVNVDNDATVVNSSMPIYMVPHDESSAPDTLPANVYPDNLQTNK